MLKKLLFLLALVLTTSSCSMLPRITFDKPGVTPQTTEKSQKKESCAGEYKTDSDGRIISCTKGYYNYEQNYSQKDRTFTLQERIANFIRNLTGWGLPLIILAIIFIPGLGGALIGFVINNIFGVASKGFKALVTGIQNGKTYVRSNGTKYTDAERAIYLKGADDMLDKITEAVTDQKVKDQIALLRAKL